MQLNVNLSIIISLAFLLQNVIGYGQNTLSIRKNSCFAVSVDKNNFLYKGIDNPVTICLEDENVDSLLVEVSVGEIRKINDEGGYAIKVNEGNQLKITVYQVKPGQKKLLIGNYFFRLKVIPNPVPYVAMKTGYGEVKKAQLLASNQLFARMENFDFDYQVRITSYAFFALKSDGTYYQEEVQYDRISAGIKETIKELSSGDRLIFERITVNMMDGTIREIGPVNLKIVD